MYRIQSSKLVQSIGNQKENEKSEKEKKHLNQGAPDEMQKPNESFGIDITQPSNLPLFTNPDILIPNPPILGRPL